MTYQIEIRSPAQRNLNRLPAKAFDAVIAFIAGPLAENPQRVGKPLRNEFEGTYSARVGPVPNALRDRRCRADRCVSAGGLTLTTDHQRE
jgi:mRNA interferase RelE/StbE